MAEGGIPQGTEDSDQTRRSNEAFTVQDFHLDRHINVAVKMISLDPNLAKVHARLISHMPEEIFWYHYFSRVAALRKDVGLEPLCEDVASRVAKVRPPGNGLMVLGDRRNFE